MPDLGLKQEIAAQRQAAQNTTNRTQSLGSTTNQNIQAPAAPVGGGLQV